MKNIEWGAGLSGSVMRSINLDPNLIVRVNDNELFVMDCFFNSERKIYRLPADHPYYQKEFQLNKIPMCDIRKILQAVKDGDIKEAQKYIPVDPIKEQARKVIDNLFPDKAHLSSEYDNGPYMRIAYAALKEGIKIGSEQSFGD